MNQKGGGLIHNTTYNSTEMKMFNGGLRHVRAAESRNIHNSFQNVRDWHDSMSYERGFIIHARSPHNQMLNFHFGYGGMYKWVVQRWIVQYFYRRVLRFFWLPALFAFFTGWATMRSYDNAVYDYFYFFDAKNEAHH